MNLYQKLLYLIVLTGLIACSETANKSKPNSRDALPDNRPVNAGFLESDSQTPETLAESFYNLAPWGTWSVGKTLSASAFTDPKILDADHLAEQLNFNEALKIYIQIKTDSFDQEESLTIRKSTISILTGKSAEAVLNLSKFYQKQKLSESQVAAESSLLFAYAYGQARNYEQSLAWFAQASESKSELLRAKVEAGLKALLPIIPNPILEQSSFTWRLNTDLARLISEERFLRQRRSVLNIPVEAFFWLPSVSSKAFGSSTAVAQSNFSQTSARKIAALLPLSGKFSKMGSALKNGVELAVQHAQANGQAIEVVFSDSESADSNENFPGVISDFTKSGAEVLIGPLVSDRAQEVEQIARSNSLPAVILSKGGSATLGEGVYRFGLTYESQAESLIAALSAQRANPRIALLYPDDEFGLGFSAAIKESLSQRKITPLYNLSYSKGNQKQMNELSKEFVTNPPELVIFADNIKASAQFMFELDLSLKKRLIAVGSATWDNPLELIQSKKALSGAIFVSAFYPDLQNPKVSQFVNDFRTRFAKAPDFFAAQGYDVALLLSQSSFNSDSINFPTTYQGISGVVKPASYGEIERELKVLQLNKGTIEPFSKLPDESTLISSPIEDSSADEPQQFNDPVVSE